MANPWYGGCRTIYLKWRKREGELFKVAGHSLFFQYIFFQKTTRWELDWEHPRQDRRDRPGVLNRRVNRTYVRRSRKKRNVFLMTCDDWTGTDRGEHPPRNTRRGDEHVIYWLLSSLTFYWHSKKVSDPPLCSKSLTKRRTYRPSSVVYRYVRRQNSEKMILSLNTRVTTQ